jgi:hypothetical protein
MAAATTDHGTPQVVDPDLGTGRTMPQDLMSQRTAELMLLLYDDGVDRDELKALVGSAFQDGVEYTIKRMRGHRDSPQDHRPL